MPLMDSSSVASLMLLQAIVLLAPTPVKAIVLEPGTIGDMKKKRKRKAMGSPQKTRANETVMQNDSLVEASAGHVPKETTKHPKNIKKDVEDVEGCWDEEEIIHGLVHSDDEDSDGDGEDVDGEGNDEEEEEYPSPPKAKRDWVKGAIYSNCGKNWRWNGSKLRQLCNKLGCTKQAQFQTECCVGHGANVNRQTCSNIGCSSYVVHGGKCFHHGAKTRCSHSGCTNFAKYEITLLCSKHGGKGNQRLLCSIAGCTHMAKRDRMCRHHGGVKCSHDGCVRAARYFKPDVCFYHSGKCRTLYDHCRHGNNRYKCTEEECWAKPSSLRCLACKDVQVSRKKEDPTSHFCMTCRERMCVIKLRIKKSEEQVKEWLKEDGIDWTYSNAKLPCAISIRFVDFVFVVNGLWCLMLEVDERYHRYYNQQCEVNRINELIDSAPGYNLHMIRFNPHGKATKEDLIQAIRAGIETNFGGLHDHGVAVQYIGYPEDRVIGLDELSCKLQREAMKTFDEVGEDEKEE